MATIPEDDTPRERNLSAKDAENLDKWKLDINEDAETVDDQRDKANEDFRFINATGGQWEGFLEDEFATRVKSQFDMVSQYKNRFIGQWNLNRVGVEYKPDDDATTDMDAKNLSGIYRADFRQFAGKLSVDQAVDEVATAGYGCFKMAAMFEDEGDAENEKQRITWRPITTAYNSIIWDNASKWIDKRDARRCTELTEYTDSSFRAAFPGFAPSSAYEPESKRWLNYLSGNFDVFFVATRYEIIKKREKVFVYRNRAEPDANKQMQTYNQQDHEDIKDELRAIKSWEFIRERNIKRQYVEKTVFSGTDILEKTKRIAGKYIPIIAIYAYRGYVDGVEWYKGFVRPLKDAQRAINMLASQLLENAASNGQQVPIFHPDQMLGGVAELWADRNNKPYMLAREFRDEKTGDIVATGPTGTLPPSQIDPSTAAMMEIATGYIQQATGGVPQEAFDPNASGKAIKALLQRENLATQDVMDNISNAIEWSGVVYQEMAKDIYNTPRIMQTIGVDGSDGQVEINKTIMDEDSGRLIQANDIHGKRFRCHSAIGPQYDTEREAKVEELKGMLDILGQTQAGQKYTPAIIATILVESEGPGAGPLKKMARRDLIVMGLLDPETDEEKQFAQEAAQEADQPDPQEQLIKSAAAQAEGEARERESKVADNVASAQKKIKETEKISQDMLIEADAAQIDNTLKKGKGLVELRNEVFKNNPGIQRDNPGVPRIPQVPPPNPGFPQ